MSQVKQQESAYGKQLVFDLTLEAFEVYIKKTNYYPHFRNKNKT
nr:12327_t:CDS:2 [Entrophospora candida]